MKKLRKMAFKTAVVFACLFTFGLWSTAAPVLAARNDPGNRQDEKRDRDVSRDRQQDRTERNRPEASSEDQMERNRSDDQNKRVMTKDRPGDRNDRGPARAAPPTRVVKPTPKVVRPAPKVVRPAPRPVYPEGRVVHRLPAGHRPIWVGNHEYYYHSGYFYNRGPSGYVIIRPPRGAVVFSLPIGFTALVLAGITYYLFEGTYYMRVPTGYVVVDPPAQVAVAKPVEPVVPTTPTAGETVTVTAALLNVRSGPGANFPVIAQVQKGDPLVVYGYAPDWLYVMLPGGGEYGWVMLAHTTPAASG